MKDYKSGVGGSLVVVNRQLVCMSISVYPIQLFFFPLTRKLFTSKHIDIGDSLIGDTKQSNHTPLEVTKYMF